MHFKETVIPRDRKKDRLKIVEMVEKRIKIILPGPLILVIMFLKLGRGI